MRNHKHAGKIPEDRLVVVPCGCEAVCKAQGQDSVYFTIRVATDCSRLGDSHHHTDDGVWLSKTDFVDDIYEVDEGL